MAQAAAPSAPPHGTGDEWNRDCDGDGRAVSANEGTRRQVRDVHKTMGSVATQKWRRMVVGRSGYRRWDLRWPAACFSLCRSQGANGEPWLGGVVQWCAVRVLAKKWGSAWLIAAGGIIVLPGVLGQWCRGIAMAWGPWGSSSLVAGAVPTLVHRPAWQQQRHPTP